MRKCGTCGYLILGDVDRCNHCGEAFSTASVGAAPAATEVNAAPPFAPPAAPPRFAPPTPIAAGPAPEANLPGAYAPTAWAPAPFPTTTTAAQNTSKTKIAIVVVVLLIVGSVGATYLMHREAVPAGTSDFVKGKGVTYTAPDGSYTAQFPTRPEETSDEVPVAGTSLTFNFAENSTDNYELGIGEMALPVALPTSGTKAMLDEGLKDAADGMHGTIESQTTTVDGFPAEDAHAKGPDGYPVRMLAIAAQRHVYILMARAKTGTDRLFDALKASFVSSESSV